VRKIESEIVVRPKKKKLPKEILTQKDRIERSKATEELNSASLAEMKRLELKKKKPVPQRAKIEGPREITIYRKDGIFVIFEEKLPELLWAKQHDEPAIEIIAVTEARTKKIIKVMDEPAIQTPEEPGPLAVRSSPTILEPTQKNCLQLKKTSPRQKSPTPKSPTQNTSPLKSSTESAKHPTLIETRTRRQIKPNSKYITK